MTKLEEILRAAPEEVIKQLDSLMRQLTGEDREKWLRALTELNQERNPWEHTKHLQYLRTLTLPAVVGFDVKAHFQVGSQYGVNIGYIDTRFKEDFLSGDGNWLVDAPTSSVRVRRLLFPDHPLTMYDLGGEKKVLLPLPHIWSLMERQGACQPGDLLTPRGGCQFPNAFYARNCSGGLRRVRLGVWPPGNCWAVASDRINDEDIIWVRNPRNDDARQTDYRVFTP